MQKFCYPSLILTCPINSEVSLDSSALAMTLSHLVNGQFWYKVNAVVENTDKGLLAATLPRVLKEACVHIQTVARKTCSLCWLTAELEMS